MAATEILRCNIICVRVLSRKGERQCRQLQGEGRCTSAFLYGIGEISPLGHVPEKMHAWVIRKRHGVSDQSFQLVVPTWPIGDDEVLVYVMAGGVNDNGIWARLQVPISPLDGHKHPFHIAGSETPLASYGRSAPR